MESIERRMMQLPHSQALKRTRNLIPLICRDLWKQDLISHKQVCKAFILQQKVFHLPIKIYLSLIFGCHKLWISSLMMNKGRSMKNKWRNVLTVMLILGMMKYSIKSFSLTSITSPNSKHFITLKPISTLLNITRQ